MLSALIGVYVAGGAITAAWVYKNTDGFPFNMTRPERLTLGLWYGLWWPVFLAIGVKEGL